MAEVGVEVDFGFVDEFEVGVDDDAWENVQRSCQMVVIALIKVPFSCCVERSNP